jgi:spermidine synthase
MLAFLEAYGAQWGGIWVAVGLGVPLIGYVLISLVTDRPMLFGVGSSAFMLLALTAGDYTEKTELQERDFFGVLRVTTSAGGRVRFFRHGSTVHGMQWVDGDAERRREPLGYYHRRGPIGQVFTAFSGTAAKTHVGLVGLGIGSLASYGEAGQEMTFYEIDPRVRDIARSERFTYLHDCRAKVEVVMGDARLRLARAPDGQYGLLILDAFSSDAIPVHLLTREALNDVYLPKMTGDGVLAYHISNRYLDLQPVLGNLARDAGLACRVQVDEGDEFNGRSPSVWVVMARTEADLGPLAQDPRWQRLKGDGGAVWTDDYSNLLRVFKWW